MASGYKKAGTDLDSLLKARGSSTAGANVGYKTSGTDLAQRFYASTGGDQPSSNTGFKTSSNDLKTKFRDINYADAPTITSQPSSGSYNENASMTLSVTATTSGGTLHYQWQKWNGSSWSNIGTDSSSYTDGSMALGDAGDYRVRVSDNNGTTDSSTAVIVVHENPGIVTQPSNVTCTGGDTIAFQVEADGSGTLYFEWFKNGVSLNSPRAGNIDATHDQHAIAGVVEGDEGTYTCQVTNSYGGTPATTASRTLTVNHTAITITDDPDDITAPDGTGPYALQCAASGGDGTLQFAWYQGSTLRAGPRNGNIDGTHDQHVFNPIDTGNAGTWKCRVTDIYGAGPQDSANATVTVT